MNLRTMLANTVQKYGSKIAVAMGDRRISYAQLDTDSNKVANTLLQMGLKRGDRVALLISNIPEFPAIYFGIVKIGATAVPLDTRYTIAELTSLFGSAQPRMLIAESDCIEPLIPHLSRFPFLEKVIDVSSKLTGQFFAYQEIMAAGSTEAVKVELTPQDIGYIIYTSGSTGHPRGAVLTHHSLIAEAEMSVAGFKQTADDVVVMFALPMYHAFGLEIILLSSVFVGSTVVIVSGLSIDSLLAAIEKERVTVFMGVPYTFALAVNQAEREGVKYDISSLRLCVSGGSALPAEVARRFKQYYQRDIVQIWGLTEAVAQVTTQPPDGSGKLCSCGWPLSGWKIKIVDESGRELAPNEPGLILVSGPLMQGYFNNPEATAQVLKDGWLDTGDIGRIDEDRELVFLARKKELIIVKGQNVCPSDIEEVLCTHPRIAEAAVVGVDDELRGEKVRAVVSLKPGATVTEKEIKEYCRKYMATYKVPKEVIIMPALPRTATGKVRKADLRS